MLLLTIISVIMLHFSLILRSSSNSWHRTLQIENDKLFNCGESCKEDFFEARHSEWIGGESKRCHFEYCLADFCYKSGGKKYGFLTVKLSKINNICETKGEIRSTLTHKSPLLRLHVHTNAFRLRLVLLQGIIICMPWRRTSIKGFPRGLKKSKKV